MRTRRPKAQRRRDHDVSHHCAPAPHARAPASSLADGPARTLRCSDTASPSPPPTVPTTRARAVTPPDDTTRARSRARSGARSARSCSRVRRCACAPRSARVLRPFLDVYDICAMGARKPAEGARALDGASPHVTHARRQRASHAPLWSFRVLQSRPSNGMRASFVAPSPGVHASARISSDDSERGSNRTLPTRGDAARTERRTAAARRWNGRTARSWRRAKRPANGDS